MQISLGHIASHPRLAMFQQKLDWRWFALACTAAALVLVPLLVVMLSWTSDQADVWQHLIATQLGRLLVNTVVLLLGVGVVVGVVGVSLAWLVALCDFPGRRWLDWALVLPMAMPAYVLAFVMLGVLEYSGPLQTWMRSTLGPQFAISDVRHAGTVVLVLSAVLYPYVYLLARAAFLAQGSDTLEAARSLGATPTQAFFRVALPMAKPSIVAGLALVLMETLADFGTVAIFNYDTFTTAIYKAWFDLFNLQAAAQLASLLLLFVALALLSEQTMRGKRSRQQALRRGAKYRFPLPGWRGYLAFGYAFLVLLLSFLIPLLQLMLWAWHSWQEYGASRIFDLYRHSIALAGIAAGTTVALALLLSYAKKQHAHPWLAAAIFVACLGYALPGSILAVGVVLPLGWFEQAVLPLKAALGTDQSHWLLGSVTALIIAYLVRFLRVAVGPIDTAFSRIKPSIPEAARSLGVNRQTLMLKIYVPIITPSLLTAALLVFVDVIKEMPATLLMRPFGWDTLAVRIYELTSEGEWHRAALPALSLVLVGMIPVVMAVRRTAQK